MLTLENKIKLFKRVELVQETIKTKNEVSQFYFSKKGKQTDKHQKCNLRALVSRVCQLLSAASRMNTSWEVLPDKKPILNIDFFYPSLGRPAGGKIGFVTIFMYSLYFFTSTMRR